MVHPCELTDVALLDCCEVIRTRGSGPGGQHRNKVETAVVISHKDSGLSGEATERRSQADNKRVALQRLRHKLAINFRTPRDESVGRMTASRIKNGKISVNVRHSDFPIVLAEVMDRLFQTGFDMSGVTAKLGCSNSQLLKFIRQSPAAFEFFNRHRQALGLHRLR
ncbi:MAG: peptide chain release factor-like protein [Pirellulaceae bacterium]|jgi:hypothetical protein|nr:peptide chain release factor-like protein [Mariniblastus sp.]MDB4670766.1 peptide chain release factor-like protein [Pirellulaceae bacterium]MDB4756689.1 peptide chain release factor-like protein [Mariniblastus sp.]MDG2468306.1 peptide chain release factor-like protein [Pirellulaceae bacterium]